MKRVNVEAFEDKARPEGGHAVVLLHALTATPDAPAFRLRLVDGLLDSADLALWPSGLLLPVDARTTDQGVELVIGPEITQCPLLLPGIAVEIESAALQSRGEFLWPDVTPLTRPKRRNLLGRSIAPPAHMERSRSDEGAGEQSAGALLAHPAITGQAVPGHSVAPVAPLPFAIEAPSTTADPAEEAESAADRSGEPRGFGQRDQPVDQLPLPPPARSGTVNPGVGAPGVSARTMPPATTSARSATAVPPTADPEPSNAYVHWYPHARGGRLQTDQAPGRGSPAAQAAVGQDWLTNVLDFRNGISAVRLVAMIALGVVAVELLLAAFGSGRVFMPGRRAALEASGGSPRVAAEAALAMNGVLYDAVHGGSTSPRGVPARGVSAGRALEYAVAVLQPGSAARDTEEGAFWLQRYLNAAYGDDRSLRALTQLGAAFAEPSRGEAQFVKARQIWEISGALGDPIALCFLGRLFENGVGVARDFARALQWYERAKLSGGCPQLDEAIARLK